MTSWCVYNAIIIITTMPDITKLANGTHQVYGDFEMIDEQNEKVFAFWRRLDWEKAVTALVLLNFTSGEVDFKIPLPKAVGKQILESAKLVLTNYPEREISSVVLVEDEQGQASLTLEGYEGRVYIME